MVLRLLTRVGGRRIQTQRRQDLQLGSSMTSGLYLLRVGESLYVGCSKNIEKRIERHLSDLRCDSHHNKSLQESYCKNKKATWFVLKEENNEQERFNLEIQFIKKLKASYSKIVNETDGGKVGPIAYGQKNILSGSRRTKEMIRKMKENRPPMGGELNHFYGKTHSEETISKLRASNLGKNLSPKTQFKEGHALNKKKILCVNNGKTYESAKEAGEILNIPHYTVTHNARSGGVSKSGLSFKYLENN